jgi:RNA polymerase sigma factor (sigma-70 family)
MNYLNDEELLKGCLRGSHRAQQAVFEKYGEMLFAVCIRYLQNRMDAEDAFQDGFVKIFSKINTFENRGSYSLYSWMKRVMSNQCLNYIRDFRKNREIMDLNEGHGYQHYYEEEAHHNGVTENISQEEILNIILELPEGYRTVFNLYVFEEYTHPEIAEMLKISVNTSKTQLMKARKAIIFKIEKKTSEKKTLLICKAG